MDKYSTPGVFVEEVKNLSLSIASGETAIPVIAASTEDFTLLEAGAGIDYFEVNSWLDVTARAGGNASAVRVAMAKVEAGNPASGREIDAVTEAGEKYIASVATRQLGQANWAEKVKPAKDLANKAAATEDGIADLKKTTLGQSLEAFFVNGGGRAYVCKADSVGTAVGLLSDVTLLVEAGANLNKQVVARVCTEKSGIFGVLDARNVPPSSDVTSVLPTDIGENDNVAFYYPWFKSASQHDTAPSAVMAGIYAKVDAERGVWKAPANVAVQGVVPKYVVTDNQQAKLNDHTTPINVIRSFGAGTPLVWGARTGKKASPFRYIPVRRLFNAMERDIKKTMKQAVFEPNTSATWEKVRSAIDNYLHEIWRQGGLMGEKPGDAYRISIGEGVTMTATQIQQGQMIAEVAVAPTRPAEFVVLRFSEKMQSI